MASDMQHRIRRLFGLILLVFLALIVWQSYWHLAKSDWLIAQPSNRRLARVEQNTPRGVIYDRHGRKLAWTSSGKRRYADPTATAAVLGYMDPVYGRTGVEGQWDLELAGLSRTFTPETLRRILHNEQPRGNDLELTLDLRLQQAAYDALRGKRGAAVVLEPSTGAILALATRPTFNSTTIRTDYEQLAENDDGALRNRATQDLYPPGSTMKVVTASAALMHNIPTSTTHECTGRSRAYNVNISDYRGTAHGTLDMRRAMTVSCNHYFAHTAVEVGARDFFRTAEAYGFNRHWWEKLPDYHRRLPLSIAESRLSRESPGQIPDGELAHMGFGQSTVVATPLEMAMVSAAIANDGTLMAPYLVQALRKGETDQNLIAYAPQAIGYPLDKDAALTLAAMMRNVVTEGTGRRANVSGLTVYGKTGTAQQSGGPDHAWFIGFAARQRDGEEQRIAFAVLVERGGGGGSVAAPVARDILRAWARE